MLLLGSSGVGKSALFQQLYYNIFLDEYVPTIDDHRMIMKQACVDDRMVYIDVYDPLEQDADFEHMIDRSIRGRNLFVFVYSITNQYTFEEIEILIEKVYTTKEEQSWFGVVCGNKCDLEDQRQISKQQGQEFVN
eukprot:39_1